MKISVVTAVMNQEKCIEDCILGVKKQIHRDIEHIIIDGGSTDRTLEVVGSISDERTRIVSERDRGPYDAMNKGISRATGDIVGILNADDMYADEHVLEKVAVAFENSDCDACYADLVYVDKVDTAKTLRYWKSGSYEPKKLNGAWIPPHPTFYVRRNLYEKYGLYNLNYSLAADYELMLRFIARHQIKLKYIETILVKMRVGGITNKSLSNIVKQNIEILRARREYGLGGEAVRYLFEKAWLRANQFVHCCR